MGRAHKIYMSLVAQASQNVPLTLPPSLLSNKLCRPDWDACSSSEAID